MKKNALEGLPFEYTHHHYYQALTLGLLCCNIVAALSSCSSINEADQLVPVEGTVPVDTVTVDANADLDSLYDLPVAAVPRRVLIEDHTGQTCPNCPTFTDGIHNLQAVYGSLLVPVAIHSDYMGIMEPEGLGTELGNTYFNSLGFTPKVKPAVLVSRYYGEVLTSLSDIIFYVDNVVAIPTTLDVRMKAIATNDGMAGIDVKVICCEEEGSVAGTLQVWVTEDSIIAGQDYLNGVHYTDYVHNHVLRAAVNGTLGEEVSVSGMGDAREFHYTMPLSEDWKPEHLSIVAFVYNGEEVLQVAKQKLRR